MDPITIILTALVVGAAAGLKPVAEQAVKDAYNGIKTLIQRKYANVHLDLLEEDTSSKPYQEVVKNDLAKTEAEKDQELIQHAQELLTTVETYDPKTATKSAATVGVILKDVVAAAIKLQDILVEVSGNGSASGVEATNVNSAGEINISGVRVTNKPARSTKLASSAKSEES